MFWHHTLPGPGACKGSSAAKTSTDLLWRARPPATPSRALLHFFLSKKHSQSHQESLLYSMALPANPQRCKVALIAMSCCIACPMFQGGYLRHIKRRFSGPEKHLQSRAEELMIYPAAPEIDLKYLQGQYSRLDNTSGSIEATLLRRPD